MSDGHIITWIALDRKVLVVAVEGSIHDWAAYIGAVPGNNHDMEKFEVARTGSKLPHKIAALIFPSVDSEFKWRK